MATKKQEIIEINPIEMTQTQITIVGDTPLIMHAWSEKAKKQMLDAQTGKAKGKQKQKKNPVDDFIQSMYWLTDKPASFDTEEESEAAFMAAIQNGARFGFPVTALKQAAISASFRKAWTKDKMSLRGVFFIDGGFGEFMEIKSDPPIMREDMVKVGMGTADLRYRGEFRNWSATFTLKYDENGQYPLANIINMINAGGTVCGIGEWRVERDGQNGMFHVKTT
ncbi:MAG: hypothetical protein [Caudoviricetes sp.]|nr:MAG: hypothetical protein [Caudoviricetes sp.]